MSIFGDDLMILLRLPYFVPAEGKSLMKLWKPAKSFRFYVCRCLFEVISFFDEFTPNYFTRIGIFLLEPIVPEGSIIWDVGTGLLKFTHVLSRCFILFYSWGD